MKTATLVALLGLTLPAVAQAEESDSKTSLLDGLSWELAVTGYYQLDTATPPNEGTSTEFSQPGHRAFARNHGFGLTFVNADASYSTDNFGLTINLRFGQGQDLLSPGFTPALNNLKQGFATWKPSSKLSLDLGWFDTIYGAEVSEEWNNLNFTRGALYFLMQPFNHMGLRIGYEASDSFGITFLVVNGYGVQIDNDDLPNVGVQFSLAPAENFGLVLGWFGGSTEPENENFDHFFDVVATLSAGTLDIVFNGDLRWNPDLSAVYWGVSGGVGLTFSDAFKGAARIEYLGDNDGLAGLGADDLLTATVTLRYIPVENLIFSLDNRFELAGSEIYLGNDGMIDSDTNYTITLGMTAKIGG